MNTICQSPDSDNNTTHTPPTMSSASADDHFDYSSYGVGSMLASVLDETTRKDIESKSQFLDETVSNIKKMLRLVKNTFNRKTTLNYRNYSGQISLAVIQELIRRLNDIGMDQAIDIEYQNQPYGKTYIEKGNIHNFDWSTMLNEHRTEGNVVITHITIYHPAVYVRPAKPLEEV